MRTSKTTEWVVRTTGLLFSEKWIKGYTADWRVVTALPISSLTLIAIYYNGAWCKRSEARAILFLTARWYVGSYNVQALTMS